MNITCIENDERKKTNKFTKQILGIEEVLDLLKIKMKNKIRDVDINLSTLTIFTETMNGNYTLQFKNIQDLLEFSNRLFFVNINTYRNMDYHYGTFKEGENGICLYYNYKTDTNKIYNFDEIIEIVNNIENIEDEKIEL